VAQKVKYLPAVWETWVWSLGQEGPLEKGMATHSSVLALRIPGTGRLVGCPLWGRTESDTTKATQQQQQQHVPSMPSFWRVFFILNGCWILSKALSSSIFWFLSFNLLMSYITLIDLKILKNSYIPGIKPTWSWCMMFLIHYWILFGRILLRTFASMFISYIGL